MPADMMGSQIGGKKGGKLKNESDLGIDGMTRAKNGFLRIFIG